MITPDMIARAEKARQAREESGEMTIGEIRSVTQNVARSETRFAARAKAKENDDIRESVIRQF
jgi:hypothetical protein